MGNTMLTDARPVKINVNEIPATDMRLLCAAIIHDIEEYFKDPAHVAEFEAWQKTRQKEKSNMNRKPAYPLDAAEFQEYQERRLGAPLDESTRSLIPQAVEIINAAYEAGVEGGPNPFATTAKEAVEWFESRGELWVLQDRAAARFVAVLMNWVKDAYAAGQALLTKVPAGV